MVMAPVYGATETKQTDVPMPCLGTNVQSLALKKVASIFAAF